MCLDQWEAFWEFLLWSHARHQFPFLHASKFRLLLTIWFSLQQIANSWCLYKLSSDQHTVIRIYKNSCYKYFEFIEIPKNTCAKWNSVPIWKVRSIWPGVVENRIFCLRAEISISIIYHDTFILGRLAKNMDKSETHKKVFPKLFNQKELLRDCKCSKVIK